MALAESVPISSHSGRSEKHLKPPRTPGCLAPYVLQLLNVHLVQFEDAEQGIVDPEGMVGNPSDLGVPSPGADSRPLYYRDGLGGRGGNWVDGTASQATCGNQMNQIPHHAKVRSAGSNPVFRSVLPGRENVLLR